MSVFAEHIFIRNFKSVRQLSLENCARMNLIVGRPNSGKSNILEALSLFSLPFLKGNKSGKITEMIRCENLSELFHFGNTKDPILSVMGASTCVVRLDDGQNLSVETNDGVKQQKYLVSKSLKFRPVSNRFEFPVVKRYIFPEKTIFRKRNLNFPIPPHGRNLKNQETSASGTEPRVNFFKTVINLNKNSILLFEEPDANCFLPFTTQISQEMIHNRENQYFLTTYSPFMIHDLLENAGYELAIFETSLVDFETVIRRLSEDELNKLYQKGIDLFTNTEGNL
jgi:AAA15 family ATPase/GTPase